MFECPDLAEAVDGERADPRLDEQSLRCVPGADGLGAVVLVGVVHDHPASLFRVAHVLETVTPEVLALELPPLAVPLFRLYARDRRTPPRLGGEMGTAIQAAGDVRTAGIDAPNRGYLRRLAGALLAERPPVGVVRSVLRDLASGVTHALACRLAALVGAVTPLRPRLYSQIEYDCSVLDTPSVQADHEAAHLAQREAFLRSIETPPSIRRIDDLRETGMAARLRELRAGGDVVAVVGMEHLDALDSALR